MASPISVEQSRAIPVTVRDAFRGTLPAPLPTLFSRRFGLLPPVREVRGQAGPWGAVGQERTVVTTDGGTMREVLTDIEAPQAFGYRLSDITGPMRPLVDHVEGRWTFASAGTGTLVTWGWTMYPRGAGALVLPVIAKMWRSYARQALEQLSDLLVSPGPSGDRPA